MKQVYNALTFDGPILVDEFVQGNLISRDAKFCVSTRTKEELINSNIISRNVKVFVKTSG